MNRSTLVFIPFLLVVIIAVAEMATAIYTPSLALVAAHFNVSDALAQWTVSINLLGLALSGPFYGPLSDCFGRRLVLLSGMMLFLIGSLASFLALSIEVLLVARFVQGLGAGVAVVIAFAVVRDLFDEQNSARVLSYMGMAIALSPGLAPIVGGYIAHGAGWQMCFAVVSVAAFLVVACLFIFMPETLAKETRVSFSWRSIRQAYRDAFKNSRFMSAASIPSLMIGGLWGWMAGLPLLFINYLRVPLEHYGYYGLSGILVYVIGTFINSKLVDRFSLRSLLTTGLYLALISSGLLVLAGLISIESPLILQVLYVPFALGLAFILPNGTALAFSEVKEGMGTSSALLGSLEMAAGALGVFLVGQLFSGTIVSIATIMLAGVIVSLLFHRRLHSKLGGKSSTQAA